MEGHMRSRHFRALIVFALAGLGSRAQHAGLVGTWRGTSICADREHWPACNDEQVIYEARLKHRAPDTVTVSADKVVNGVRDNMGEYDFVLAADSSWVSEFRMGGNHGRIVLRIAGTRMTGVLLDVTSGRTARKMALERSR